MEIGTVITTTVKNAKASESLKCGLCEQICPQHLHQITKKRNRNDFSFLDKF